MSYLLPPSNMSPVVVVKDFGGFVNEYAAQTELYRRTGREVRIHECHSACTMALSLPNVCVYKSSIFKFHQAYDPRNHITNWQVSDALFHTYPQAIRDRLGTLNRNFTVLRGRELIELGIRDCDEPNPRILIAKASAKPAPDTAVPGNSGWSTLTGRLGGLIPNFGTKPDAAEQPAAARPKPTSKIPSDVLAPTIPLPPEKPASTQTAETDEGQPAAVQVEPGAVPLPQPRPKVLASLEATLPPVPFMQRIEGSQPILPARFVPFPKRAS